VGYFFSRFLREKFDFSWNSRKTRSPRCTLRSFIRFQINEIQNTEKEPIFCLRIFCALCHVQWQFHRSLLEQLPLFKEAKHERKQRKICLQKLGKVRRFLSFCLNLCCLFLSHFFFLSFSLSDRSLRLSSSFENHNDTFIFVYIVRRTKMRFLMRDFAGLTNTFLIPLIQHFKILQLFSQKSLYTVVRI